MRLCRRKTHFKASSTYKGSDFKTIRHERPFSISLEAPMFHSDPFHPPFLFHSSATYGAAEGMEEPRLIESQPYFNSDRFSKGLAENYGNILATFV